MNSSNPPHSSPSAPLDPKAVSNLVGQVFRPSSPVDALDLFTGRIPQYQKLLDTIGEAGRHAIVFGERAVGKSSLVSILRPLMQALSMPHHVARFTGGSKETFASLWRAALRSTAVTHNFTKKVMFHEEEKTVHTTAEEMGELPQNPTAIDVKLCLDQVPNTVYIFDEFDQLHRNERRLFTALLKILSDHAVPTTIILVGIADTVDELVADHRSITRAVSQVRVPRMNRDEIRDVLGKGEAKLGIRFEQDAKTRIETMAQGLPHYAHLLGKHSVRRATSQMRLNITLDDIKAAEKTAISEVDQVAVSAYLKATQSARKDAQFQQTLLACAVAPKDELGFFRASAVTTPLSTIMKYPRGVEDCIKHLEKFVKRERGPILQRSGPQRGYKYRFLDPLLPPFTILKSLEQGVITEEQLNRLTADPTGYGPLFALSAAAVSPSASLPGPSHP